MDDHKIKRIEKRSWGELRTNWLSNLPLIQNAGEPPANEICEDVNLQIETEKVLDAGEYKTDIAGLRENVFREGIFLMHKAFSVAGACELHITNGFLSWSSSESYQSSFFGMKAILCFLGITLPRIRSCDYIVDVYPMPEAISNNRLRKGFKPDQLMKIIKAKSLQHLHIWKIFQRVLNVATVEIWNEEIVNFLLKLDEFEFAFQRNNLHYKNNFWLVNDLIQATTMQGFAERNNLLNELDTIDSNQADFSAVLNFILLHLCYQLFKDIANIAPIISPEYDLITQVASKSKHDLYRKMAFS